MAGIWPVIDTVIVFADFSLLVNATVNRTCSGASKQHLFPVVKDGDGDGDAEILLGFRDLPPGVAA